MALTRAYLKGMGLTEEQVSAIVEAHMDTVNGLREQVKQFQTDAESLKEVQKQLDELKGTGSDWEKKYNSEHKAFEEFKSAKAAEHQNQLKKDAFLAALKSAGIAEKYMDTVIRASQADIEKIEFDDKGTAKNSSELAENIKKSWSDFIVTTTEKGAEVPTPPAQTGTAITKEQFAKMGYKSRAELHQNNPELYESLVGN